MIAEMSCSAFSTRACTSTGACLVWKLVYTATLSFGYSGAYTSEPGSDTMDDAVEVATDRATSASNGSNSSPRCLAAFRRFCSRSLRFSSSTCTLRASRSARRFSAEIVFSKNHGCVCVHG